MEYAVATHRDDDDDRDGTALPSTRCPASFLSLDCDGPTAKTETTDQIFAAIIIKRPASNPYRSKKFEVVQEGSIP